MAILLLISWTTPVHSVEPLWLMFVGETQSRARKRKHTCSALLLKGWSQSEDGQTQWCSKALGSGSSHCCQQQVNWKGNGNGESQKSHPIPTCWLSVLGIHIPRALHLLSAQPSPGIPISYYPFCHLGSIPRQAQLWLVVVAIVSTDHVIFVADTLRRQLGIACDSAKEVRKRQAALLGFKIQFLVP